jgi:hypothetical protein
VEHLPVSNETVPEVAPELNDEMQTRGQIRRMRAWIIGLATLVVISTTLFVALYSLFRSVLRNEALRDTRQILVLSTQDKLVQVKSSGLADDFAVESMQELLKAHGAVEDFKIVESHVGLPGLPIIVKAEVKRKGVVAPEFYVFHRAVMCNSVSRVTLKGSQ